MALCLTDSSRFNGDPMAFLHEHRRRVPTQDHLCRIGVGVFKVVAACAEQARLVLTTLTVTCTTRRTSLARVLSGNLNQFTAPFFQLVAE